MTKSSDRTNKFPFSRADPFEDQEHDDGDADVQLGYCSARLLNFALAVLTLGFVAAVAFPVGCYLRSDMISIVQSSKINLISPTTYNVISDL